MSNTKWCNVYDYFEVEESSLRCKILIKDSVSCERFFNKLKQGSLSSNLKRHLMRHHPEQY